MISENIVYYEGISLKEQEILNAWEIIVSAWERKIEFVCVSLALNAWDLRALHRALLKTGPEVKSLHLCPENLNVPRTKSRETLRFEGNKIRCSLRDKSLSVDLLCNKTKQKRILKNTLRFQQQHQATFNCTLCWRAVNISRVTLNCFPFDTIFFSMLPTHGIWQ